MSSYISGGGCESADRCLLDVDCDLFESCASIVAQSANDEGEVHP